MSESATSDERLGRIQDFSLAQIAKIVSDTQHVADRLKTLHDEVARAKYGGVLRVDGGQRARAGLKWLATFASRLQAEYDNQLLNE